MQNHFELFQLPAQFGLDMSALDSAYRDVQGKVHPDRFINASSAEKRVAMQWATRANEAYQTLKSPQKRAQYLCELNGVDLQTESNTAMPVSFLMQQMEWREELGDARAGQDAPHQSGIRQQGGGGDADAGPGRAGLPPVALVQASEQPGARGQRQHHQRIAIQGGAPVPR